MTERFQLLEQLGRGAMGSVWKARDAETGQLVALKLIHAHLAQDPGYLARFEREVEVARRIHSPYVVQVLGYGKQEGLPYIAMEYVEGESLRQLLARRGTLPWSEASRLTAEVAAGLRAAHQANVIHRDIKPSNILITRDGHAKIADFGIARAADMTALTGSSTMLGTPQYMSPDGAASPASDFYALGCVAYEMLAGAPPFEGESLQEVIVRHIREEPDLTKLPVEARPLVGGLLSKEKGERIATAAILAHASKPTTPPAPRQRAPTKRLGIAAGITVVLAAGSLLAFLSAGPGTTGERPYSVAEVAISGPSLVLGENSATLPPFPSTSTALSDAATGTTTAPPTPTSMAASATTPTATPTAIATATSTPTAIPTPTPSLAATPTSPIPGTSPPRPTLPNAPIPQGWCGGLVSSHCLTWRDYSDNEDGFNVYMNRRLYMTVGPNVTTISTDGLQTGVTFCMTVGAFNAAGENKRDADFCFEPPSVP